MNNNMLWLIAGLGLLWMLSRPGRAAANLGSAPAPGIAGSLGYQISGDPLYD